MAGLEVIASIVGIAGVGIKLSKTLYQIGHKTATAGHNINRIATNVSLFASMLKHVGSVLDDAQSLHSPEAVETVKQIVKECESVFQEIADIIVLARDQNGAPKEPQLANGGKRRMNILAKAKWYFEGPKAEHLLAQLEYLKTTLSVLLQTLNLAALTAKVNATLGESEKSPEIVQQEKLHIGTLIVAQQLSVAMVHETQDKMEEESTRPSSPSDDSSEPRYPKLLTQGSTTSLQMVRLNDNEVEFLDRRPSVAGEDGASLEPSISRSDSFIQELLERWTVPPEQKFALAVPATAGAQSVEPEREATPVPLAGRHRHASEDTHDGNVTPVPDVHVNPPVQRASSPLTNGPPRNLMSPRSDMATLASRETPTSRPGSSIGYQISETSSIPSRIMSPRIALERSMTNPEADGLPVLNSFHDHHGLQPAHRFASPAPPYMAQTRGLPSAYQPGALAPYMAGAAAASGNARLSPNWGNYRQPYVSDEDSTWSPSDSEDSRPNSRAGKTSPRTRRDSNTSNVSGMSRRRSHQPRDSGTGEDAGDGLDIPWRIRVSQGKCFDFRDSELVGPRTPYLPQEPKSWIYGHEAAHTEISKQWVCIEALTEMRYPHTELRGSKNHSGVIGEEGGWRILQPLKFHEIDQLVNLTIQHVEQAKKRKSSGPAPSPPQGPPQARPPLQQHLSMPQMPPQPPMQQRPGPYPDGLPPLQPPTGPPPRFGGPQVMSPRDMYDAPYSPRDRPPPGRGDWRERDHDLDYARERRKERRRSRSRHRRREEKREKEVPEKKEKKHKGSGMGTTLAKVGTLAMLLEGLDGAF